MKEKIAIIGSGMAGLAAGWFCHQTGREVTIVEAHHRRGMDVHTILFGESGQSGHVDIPLRVMSAHSWPSVLELCCKVGVKTFPEEKFVIDALRRVQRTVLRCKRMSATHFRKR